MILQLKLFLERKLIIEVDCLLLSFLVGRLGFSKLVIPQMRRSLDVVRGTELFSRIAKMRRRPVAAQKNLVSFYSSWEMEIASTLTLWAYLINS